MFHLNYIDVDIYTPEHHNTSIKFALKSHYLEKWVRRQDSLSNFLANTLMIS